MFIDGGGNADDQVYIFAIIPFHAIRQLQDGDAGLSKCDRDFHRCHAEWQRHFPGWWTWTARGPTFHPHIQAIHSRI